MNGLKLGKFQLFFPLLFLFSKQESRCEINKNDTRQEEKKGSIEEKSVADRNLVLDFTRGRGEI